MTNRRDEKILQGIGSLAGSSGSLLLGSGSSTIISSSSNIFPYIQIQTGLADGLIIGTVMPATANFTDITASSLTLFNNIIHLGDSSNSIHGLDYGTQFFGTDTNVFTYTTSPGTLGSARFSSLSLGYFGASITNSGPNLGIVPGSGGVVTLPRGTVAYQPETEHLQGDLSIDTEIQVSGRINISFIIITRSTGSVPIELPLEFAQEPIVDGFLKTIVVQSCPVGSWGLIKFPIGKFKCSDDNVNYSTSEYSIQCRSGIVVQLTWNLLETCWYVHGNGGRVMVQY